MKKTLSVFFLFVLIIFYAQRISGDRLQVIPKDQGVNDPKYIEVNTSNYVESNYTIQQLIENVLINDGSACSASVSNVTVSPNLTIQNAKSSFGYFNKGTTDFPFKEGIILMNGPAKTAGNSFIPEFLEGTLPTKGDKDLAKALNVDEINLYDATSIEFDFVPTNSRLSFNYIFSSEEYLKDFACAYTDGFALLIKKAGDLNYTNLAVLPNGDGPVSVTNIHPANAKCPAVNEKYYAGDNSDPEKETNFAGRTIPLTAVATVIPGQTYHFKIVLADYSDRLYDTGVFLKAGSFKVGAQIFNENGDLLPESLSICDGTSRILDADVAVVGTTYQWYFNGTIIPGATLPKYTVSIAGVYKVEILLPGSPCRGEAQITIRTPGDAIVTLSAAKTTICVGESVILTASGADKYTFIGLPGTGNTRTVSPTQTTTYTVTGEIEGGCGGSTATITITVIPSISSTLQDVQICKGSTAVLDAGAGTNYSYLWSTGETSQKISVEKEGIYSVTIDNGVCSDNFSATVSYVAIPIIDEVIYEKNALTIIIKPPLPQNLEYSINNGLNWQTSNVFQNVLPNTNYQLAVRVSGQLCFTTAEYYTFFVTNIISLNADGFNDRIDFLGVRKNKEFSALIFDRYGKEVFRSTSTNFIWKGDDSRRGTPTAAYWYQVFWIDNASGKVIQKTGWIVVKNRN